MPVNPDYPHSDCINGYYCDFGAGGPITGICLAQKGQGGACGGSGNNECTAGLFCVDGFCCNDTCTGLCKSCDGGKTGLGNGS